MTETGIPKWPSCCKWCIRCKGNRPACSTIFQRKHSWGASCTKYIWFGKQIIIRFIDLQSNKSNLMFYIWPMWIISIELSISYCRSSSKKKKWNKGLNISIKYISVSEWIYILLIMVVTSGLFNQLMTEH